MVLVQLQSSMDIQAGVEKPWFKRWSLVEGPALGHQCVVMDEPIWEVLK
jgi:hypothetical protein